MVTKKEINGFTLQPEIYEWNGRFVKIYCPILVLDNNMAFWVYCLDDKDITIANSKHLKLANSRIQVLFGGK
jgi:hypothetical protein